MRLAAGLLAAITLIASPAVAQDGIRVQAIDLPTEGGNRTITGRIKGHDSVDHVVRVANGRALSVDLAASHGQAYFNVLPPGSTGEAIFIGSTSGDHFSAEGLAAGDYRIRVYLMRAAARRGEAARYTLDVAVKQDAFRAVAVPGQPFDRTLSLHGVSFRVTGGDGRVTVTPTGLAAVNRPEAVPVSGRIATAEIADLNVDGAPEVYVFVRGAAANQAGELVAFASNRNQSMSRINLPELTAPQRAGYRGDDEMAVVENTLVRRFPLHGRDGNPERRQNRTRQIQYKLKPGEAMWQLVVDRVLDY
jgi:hypothetical protein